MLKNLFKSALAALLILAYAAMPASALYNDQTRKYLPRFIPNEQVVQYYRLTINYNDPNISTGQIFGALGSNTYILSIDAYVSTAFNAGSTNVITLGATSSSANEIVASGITAGTTGVYHLTSAAGLGLAVTGNSTYQQNSGVVPAYVPLYAKYAQTGTAATAGSVTIVIAYVPNNDM